MGRQKNHAIVWIALLVVAASPASPQDNGAAQASTTLSIVLPGGPYHGQEVPYEPGSDWFALVQDGKSSRLTSVNLKVDLVFDAVLDTEEGPFTGKTVSFEPTEPALVLLKGGILRAGTVAAASVEGQSRDLTAKKLTFNGKSYSVGLNDGCFKAAGVCQWSVTDGSIKQVIAEFHVSPDPEGKLAIEGDNAGLIWGGDLDRDGKLDLIVDVSDHENVGAHILVLQSSMAKTGRFFENAGTFVAVGC